MCIRQCGGKFGDAKTGAPFPSMVVVFRKGTAKRELAQLSMLYESGHPDRAGIELAIEDNLIQDAHDTLEENMGGQKKMEGGE